MSSRTIITYLIIALIVFGIAVALLPYKKNAGSPAENARQTALVDAYIRENISLLSPEKAVAGGTYYVTDISFGTENINDGGRVSYEDGHVAHVASFTYTIQGNEVEILTFTIEVPENVYKGETLGLWFKYPSNYVLEAKDSGTDQRRRTTLVLIEDTAENASLRAGTTTPREGPVAITIDIHQNVEEQAADAWIKTSQNSNFNLSDKVLTPTTLSGRQALAYRSTGLYEARNVVVATPDYIYAFAVTYLTPDDQILKDFDAILKTVSIQEIQ